MQNRKNKLGDESSPYLLQHKDNPIWWLPWGDEAFALAKAEDKPIFLSVGYATCHWCHVMEGDSFEKQDVADLLNKHFIAIKVDREERPDVDAIYMAAVQAMTGGGGWPMSIIMTPEREPFWTGTFLPRDRFKYLLAEIARVWTQERAQILQTSQTLTSHLQTAETLEVPGEINTKPLEKFFEDQSAYFDAQHGGFGGAPKFPPSMALRCLLRLYRRSGNLRCLHMVTKTLDAMARGGIYDHLGGGFHRYAVDKRWFAPHFEKMLYDNALVPQAYLEAFQVTGKADYSLVAEQTLDYVLRDLRLPEGGFASAEDADSEKTEGKFYTWQQQELKMLLTADEFRLFTERFSCSEAGNFQPEAQAAELERAAGMGELEQANILYLNSDAALTDWQEPLLKSARDKLLAARKQRIRPLRDDKILTGWNGLMIATLAMAGRILHNNRFTAAAREAADFLWQRMWRDGSLLRRYRNGDAGVCATLEDYAYLIQGFLELYRTEFDEIWLTRALTLQDKQDALFWDAEAQNYFDTDGKDASLLLRKRDFFDSAVPSGNAVAAHNCAVLGKLFYDQTRTQRAEQIVSGVMAHLSKYPRGFPQMLLALDMLTDKAPEVAIVGDDDPAAAVAIEAFQKAFLPTAVLAAGSSATVPLLKDKNSSSGLVIHVCHDRVCELPTADVAAALDQAQKATPLALP